MIKILIRVQLSILFLAIVLTACGQTINVDEIQNKYDSGNYQEAITLSNKALPNMKTTDANYEKVIRIRLNSFLELQDYKSAISDFKSLINVDSTNIYNYVGLAFANWSMDNDKHAISAINKAYEINPKDPIVLSNMAYFHGQYGNYEQSIAFSNAGLEQSNLDRDNKAVLLNNRGYALIGLKKYAEALSDINASINLNGYNSFAYCYRALVNIELNQMETVCSDLQKSKSLGGETLTKDLIEKYCKP